ncbi:ATP-binding protein [Streptomyces sp. NBC_01381]|uniref:ATP-binding protein n=1 Tax=Streptomyces sp. NBC_01381 TaxID=2903845 RepID=UPI00224D78D5|nr:ATP-binding protein [Streptomyces sp. NBC_01381]MCX4669714.1 ATP-binding protein [Streptomyces sp. NBC_01381]
MEDQPHPHPRPTDVSLVFPPHPAWVRAARETVRTLLAATGRAELTDTAVLLTSEAVTNAINACAAKQCTAPVSLFAGYGDPGGHLRILIHDEAPGLPRCQSPAEDDETGRGIQLISFGADAWGICRHGPGSGKATWFELGRRPLGGEGELSTGPATPENPPLL